MCGVCAWLQEKAPIYLDAKDVKQLLDMGFEEVRTYTFYCTHIIKRTFNTNNENACDDCYDSVERHSLMFRFTFVNTPF